MKTKRQDTKRKAFTLIELLAVIAVLMLLAVTLLPALDLGGQNAQRIQCANNLKLSGLELRRWSPNHGDKLPMAVPAEKGGTMEFVEGGNAYRHFQVISANDQPEDPKIFVCPADNRRPAKRFADLQNANVSYFVGLDVTDSDAKPTMFLMGDRNLTNGLASSHSILQLRQNRPTGWTGDIHYGEGNVGLADGSVQKFTTDLLRKALKYTGDATNRIALPE